jgi:hypothetical protein
VSWQQLHNVRSRVLHWQLPLFLPKDLVALWWVCEYRNVARGNHAVCRGSFIEPAAAAAAAVLVALAGCRWLCCLLCCRLTAHAKKSRTNLPPFKNTAAAAAAAALLFCACRLPPVVLSAVVPFDGSCEELEPSELEEARSLSFLDG